MTVFLAVATPLAAASAGWVGYLLFVVRPRLNRMHAEWESQMAATRALLHTGRSR